jgi:hypothetical protein
MKSKLTVILAATLMVTILPSANAFPVIGGKCKVEGAYGHLAGKPFMCVRVGKDLKYQYTDESKLSGLGGVKSDVKVDPIVQKAYAAYDHTSCKGNHPNFSANYLVSPNYSPGMLIKQKANFEQAMSCYNNYFDKNVEINIALVTEKDYDFLATQTTNGKSVFDDKKLRWSKFMMDRLATGKGRFAGSAGWSVDTGSAWVLMIDSTSSTSPDAHGAAHEFVHILQSYSKSNNFPFYGDGSTDADYVNLPTWFWEGTAELFSYASISPTPGYFSGAMASARLQAKESPSFNKISTPDKFVSTMKLLEAPTNQEANMMFYALGSVECEYILETYGYAKYWQIMKNASKYLDFNENLKNTIGISKDELYAKSAPFVLSQWKLSKF